MISLLLSLGLCQAPDAAPDAAPATQEAQATLQSCEMTPAGWVCHYRMPAVILQGAPPESVTVTDPAAITLPAPPSARAPTISPAEADRQARLIARCADASWLSLCLPGDRREARTLRDAANAKAALRMEVTRLLSDNQCAEAVRTALAGGDMALAREARDFCAAAAPNTDPD